MVGMITWLNNATDDELRFRPVGRRLNFDGDADTVPTGRRDKGKPLFSPLLAFSPKGGFKVDH